ATSTGAALRCSVILPVSGFVMSRKDLPQKEMCRCDHSIDSSVVQIGLSRKRISKSFAFQDLWHDDGRRSATNFSYCSAIPCRFKSNPCQIPCHATKPAKAH